MPSPPALFQLEERVGRGGSQKPQDHLMKKLMENHVRKLRQNSSKAEKRLWTFLRSRSSSLDRPLQNRSSESTAAIWSDSQNTFIFRDILKPDNSLITNISVQRA